MGLFNEAGDSARIAVCVKWVDLRPEVDSLTGHVRSDGRSFGFSFADEAAVESALRLGDRVGAEVAVICAGPADCEGALRGLLAAGVASVARVALNEEAPSELTAVLLASAVRGAGLVLCGDYSMDRGSGSVPAFLAHHLGIGQALGLVSLDVEDAALVAGRRLDGGRREVVCITGPAVLSVEGGAVVLGSHARLRRAPLAATLRANDAPVTVLPGPPGVHQPAAELRTKPLRPRARALPAPTGGTALDRVVELTGALVDRTPPRTVEADPEEAAELILQQLMDWGYRS